jgi:ABC-type sulfate transport system permease subunit
VAGITAKAMLGGDNWQRALVFGVQLATAVAIGEVGAYDVCDGRESIRILFQSSGIAHRT